ncbi:B3 domain-containing protein Os04g0386900-like [Silene latifolia]|uniref:B3 domain-containing protein Os04g0386900-like n=1 Tax=Silene latifolia TaxID=37657 RepID=UPI003D7788B8
MDQENAAQPIPAIICADDIEIEPLTGKPFFDVTMCKSYIQNHLPLPTKFIELLPENVSVPVILTHGSRSWTIKYSSHQYSQKRFYKGWKKFVDDNMLKIGDVCLFEIISCHATLIKLKVQILRADFPSALLNRERQSQDSPEVAIEIE